MAVTEITKEVIQKLLASNANEVNDMLKELAQKTMVESGVYEDMQGVPSYATRDFMVKEITGAAGEDSVLVREGEVGKVEYLPGHTKLTILKHGRAWISVKFPSTEFVWFFPVDDLSDPE